MRSVLLLLLVTASFSTVLSQPPSRTRPRPTPAPIPSPTPTDTERLDAAAAMADLAERINLLSVFIADRPDSDELARAREMLTAARAAHGEAMLDAGNADAGTDLIKLAFTEAPTPWPDRLFAEIISKLPTSLYIRGQRAEALAMAGAMEEKLSGDPAKLVSLAGFYLGIESGANAKRLVEKAIAGGNDSAEAYVVLGLAERLSFDMAASEKAYSAALERRPDSGQIVSALADVRRAAGKPAEALELYRRLLLSDPDNAAARTGFVMSLYETGRTEEADEEFESAAASNPGNVLLFASAAYRQAAAGNGERAAELASRAIGANPRYIWSHIALARALALQGKPVDAERVLLAARKYGNFPTLQYEIALVRSKAGFFRDAADELKKSFSLQDGMIGTRLGGQAWREAATFGELLAGERQASLFAYRGPDDGEDAARLAKLLAFSDAIEASVPDAEKAVAAARTFSAGGDNMRVHRLLFVASRLLNARIDPDAARELALEATGTTDAGLAVADPAVAVMAEALYDGRQAAIARDEYLLVPEVPRQTLSAVLRGRIEELAGRGYLEKGEHAQAVIRFRRALSVLPKDSLWWRNTKWDLGNSLAAEGNDAEALENYIDAYDPSRPDTVKYAVIEGLYQKVNETLDGLEAKIGPNPIRPTDAQEDVPGQDEIAGKETKNAEPDENTDETPTETEPVRSEEIPDEEKKEESKPEETETEPEKTEEVPAEEEKKEDIPVEEEKEESKPEETEPEKTEDVPAEEEKKDPVEPEQKPAEKTDTEPEKTEETLPEKKEPDEKEAEDETPAPKEEPETGEPAEPKTEPEKTGDETNEDRQPLEENDQDVGRPRVVSDAPVNHINFEPCLITSTQDNISIINNGGNLGIIIGIDGDAEAMKVVSSSPEDVEVKEQTKIAGASKRIFYIIRSISTRTGEFTVLFQAPCGKKEVNVRVR
ncbi:MAG: tetratricopeptide repeat protein [Acidobacteria bacterium]|nr:tetratricopeptide repeat protein [Acidobacteriota bacterium]